MTIASSQDAVFAFLADPATHHGHSVERSVERIDTHISCVFLAGDRAWKVKKNVTLPFLDFSSLDGRHNACQQEVKLNRRTAPDLYLGVVPITRGTDGRLMLGGTDEVVEWAIEMQRFPQESLLSAIAQREGLPYHLLLDVAESVARFHNEAEILIGPFGERGIRDIITKNQAATAPHHAPQAPHHTPEAESPILDTTSVHDLFARLFAEVDRLKPLLDARRESGSVRHCHGDLHLGNICLADGKPLLFDCIEFNDLFSSIDTLYDLAFLMMDVLHAGFQSEASMLLNAYLEWRNDLDGLAALPLFIAVRAQIRSFISASISHSHPNPEVMRTAARQYHAEALRSLEPARPIVVAVGGLSGSGKSRCARHLAPFLGGVFGGIVLRTDIIRKRILDHDPYKTLPPSAYTGDMSRKTYDTLYDDMRRVIAAGLPVVADAVFAKEDERDMVQAVAAELGVPFCGVWLDADPAVAAERIETRRRTPSDATVEFLEKQLAWDLGHIRWTRINSSGSREDTDARALAFVQECLIPSTPQQKRHA